MLFKLSFYLSKMAQAKDVKKKLDLTEWLGRGKEWSFLRERILLSHNLVSFLCLHNTLVQLSISHTDRLTGPPTLTSFSHAFSHAGYIVGPIHHSVSASSPICHGDTLFPD